jgi:hypothetical protein
LIKIIIQKQRAGQKTSTKTKINPQPDNKPPNIQTQGSLAAGRFVHSRVKIPFQEKKMAAFKTKAFLMEEGTKTPRKKQVHERKGPEKHCS